MSVLWFILVITTIVFIHELGHFTVARLCGVKVNTFSIGFGKSLVSWRDSKNTKWSIGWLPLGGYVKMDGEMIRSKNEELDDNPNLFINKSLWQKAAIVFAGPLANYILAIVIISSLLMINGYDLPTNEVTKVIAQSPAELAGIKEGDLIIAIGQKKTNNLAQIIETLKNHQNINSPVEVTVLRNGEETIFKILLREDNGRKILGVVLEKTEKITLSLWEGITKSTIYVVKASFMMLQVIGQMITGQRGTEDLGSLGTIASHTTKSMEYGWNTMLYYVALLSLNLGLLNLLPIPLLDGGHLLYYLIEGITGRPISDRLQSWSMKIGIAIIALLMIIGVSNDIKNLLLK